MWKDSRSEEIEARRLQRLKTASKLSAARKRERKRLGKTRRVIVK